MMIMPKPQRYRDIIESLSDHPKVFERFLNRFALPIWTGLGSTGFIDSVWCDSCCQSILGFDIRNPAGLSHEAVALINKRLNLQIGRHSITVLGRKTH